VYERNVYDPLVRDICVFLTWMEILMLRYSNNIAAAYSWIA
jgi:hypothetical protein